MTDEQIDAIAVAVLMRERRLTREMAEHWMALLPETVKLHRAMIRATLREAARIADHAQTHAHDKGTVYKPRRGDIVAKEIVAAIRAAAGDKP